MTDRRELMQISVSDGRLGICVTNYADTVVFDNDRNLVAVRFGGYPESVTAMSDAIFAGCKLTVLLPDEKRASGLQTKGVKNYERKVTHDGVYAEGFVSLMDDARKSLQLTEDEKVSANREMYIFCNNENELFGELDNKLSVPLIPEYSDFLIEKLLQKNILKRLHIYSLNRPFFGWVLNVTNDEKEIAEILRQGLKKGEIFVPGAKQDSKAVFAGIGSFTDYLSRFGPEIAQRIKDSFKPVFTPGEEDICNELKVVNEHIREHTGYSLFDAQLAGAEALKRRLEKDKMSLLVASCGTGKTKIGAAAVYAYQQSGSRKGQKAFNVITCPSHVAKKWVRELNETVPDCIAQAVSRISEVDRLYDVYNQSDKTVYCVLSKETARNGYLRKPSVIWNKRRKGFVCPDCGAVQEMKITDDGSSYYVKADSLFYKSETSENHKCASCHTVLWSALNPDVLSPERNEWVHVSGYGFVHRKFASLNLMPSVSGKARDKIGEIIDSPDAIYPAIGAYRRYPLSRYIKHKFRTVDALICDELHEYSGESAQGEAMGELAGIAKKVVGMTATLINGYSKGMFYLLFRLKPHLMLLDGQSYRKPNNFCQSYGVVESIYRVENETYNAASKNRSRKVREKFLPGISPLVYSRFLMENTVFLSLSDMGKELPDYEEIPISCTMSDCVKQEYERMEKAFKSLMRENRKMANRILSVYLNLLTAYPDQPYGHEPVQVKGLDEPLIIPKSFPETVSDKDNKVLEIIEGKVRNGEKVIFYTAWVRLDTQDKMQQLLKEKGLRVCVLRQNVPATMREEWVRKKVEEGINVLITNPILVQTGLDLNDFTTLIFYNIAFNLYVLRQASCRSYRINQTAPKIEVYLFYYKNTMQQRALRLMASKLAAATMIEGQISEEGLAAMSDCQDMTTQLAKDLMNGIKEDVEDLSATFKRMAVHNDRKAEIKQEVTIPISVIPPVHVLQPVRPKNKKEEEAGQLSLFDLLAS